MEAKKILKDENDSDIREMAKEILDEGEEKLPQMEEKLKILLLPKDPLDEKNVIIEIRAGPEGTRPQSSRPTFFECIKITVKA